MEGKNNFNVSVILPLSSSLVKSFEDLLDKSIKSLENQVVGINELVIVHSKEESLKNALSKINFGDLNVKMVENEGPTDFASDVDAFLPLVVDIDDKGVFAGFTNEATFAVSLNSEMGYLTNDVLQAYQNFQSSGMVIKKDTFLENGGLKPSIKLTFVYEMFLRLTYNSVKIMTIPRIGYKHMNMREGSIFWNYKFGEEKLADKEVLFWLESAKKEHFFTSDRDIKYTPETV